MESEQFELNPTMLKNSKVKISKIISRCIAVNARYVDVFPVKNLYGAEVHIVYVVSTDERPVTQIHKSMRKSIAAKSFPKVCQPIAIYV